MIRIIQGQAIISLFVIIPESNAHARIKRGLTFIAEADKLYNVT